MGNENQEAGSSWFDEKKKKEGKKEESVEVDITIHNSYKGKISVPKGISLKELLEIVAKEYGIRVSEFRIILDGKTVNLSKENPLILNNSTLSLLKKICGGHLRGGLFLLFVQRIPRA